MSELRALVDGYGVALDERDGPTFAALFTDDATLAVVKPDGTESGRHVGAAALAAVPEKLSRYDRTLHLISTHRTRVDGDRATGVAYCEAHHREGEGDFVMFIRYEDEYRLTADGWRIAHRVVRTQWVEKR